MALQVKVFVTNTPPRDVPCALRSEEKIEERWNGEGFQGREEARTPPSSRPQYLKGTASGSSKCLGAQELAEGWGVDETGDVSLARTAPASHCAMDSEPKRDIDNLFVGNPEGFYLCYPSSLSISRERA